MKHNLHTTIPKSLDRKLRWRFRMRLWRGWIGSPAGIASVALGTYAAFIVLFLGVYNLKQNNDELFASNIREKVLAVQDAELAKASEGIYHMRWIVAEGRDKESFVKAEFGEAPDAPVRVDVIESWQHNNNALAQVRSTAHRYAEHAYLKRETDSTVALYFQGVDAARVPQNRELYDKAHDLSSLYSGFATTSAPDLPRIPASARVASTEPLEFVDESTEGLEIRYEVDADTLQLTRKSIYVLRGEDRYEMSTITYLERSIEPADTFETTFDTDREGFERIAIGPSR